jgi:flagellar biosynthesis protein FlhA
MFSLSMLKANTDVFIAVGIIGILLVMILPLPASVLDLLLAMNLALSLVTLLVALYTREPLEFAIFPSLLLFLTLFRLALNISSTRASCCMAMRGQTPPERSSKPLGTLSSAAISWLV